MKAALTFVMHLAIALLAVPMLALIFGGVIGKSVQFYYDHVFLFTSFIGALLAYWVCRMLSSRSAVWVWIPPVIAFVIWVAVWFSSGSVLSRGSVIEHFITSDCPVDPDGSFPAHCADKL